MDFFCSSDCPTIISQKLFNVSGQYRRNQEKIAGTAAAFLHRMISKLLKLKLLADSPTVSQALPGRVADLADADSRKMSARSSVFPACPFLLSTLFCVMVRAEGVSALSGGTAGS
jgi:hypothetical protein